jgi:hypothetical protein
MIEIVCHPEGRPGRHPLDPGHSVLRRQRSGDSGKQAQSGYVPVACHEIILPSGRENGGHGGTRQTMIAPDCD